jgi:hypothetical protein
MLSYWINFARNGNPNSSGFETWPQYQAATDCYMELKATPDGSQKGVRTTKCNLWDNLAGFAGCTSTLDAFTSENLSIGVFPNPSKGLVKVIGTDANTTSIQVFNQNGMLVTSCERCNQTDLSAFPAGLYVLQIWNGEKLFSSRVIKE